MKRNKKMGNENEGVIHRDITENEIETNWDTLNRVTKEFPDNTPPIVIEECDKILICSSRDGLSKAP